MIYLYCPEGVAGGIYDNNVHNMSMVSAAMRGNVSFVRTGRIGQWDDYKLGSGSYVRTGRRMTRKRQYRKNTDPDGCVGCPDKQTSSKWASKLVKPTGGGVQDVLIYYVGFCIRVRQTLHFVPLVDSGICLLAPVSVVSRVCLRPSVLRCWRALLLQLCVLPFCNLFPRTYIRRRLIPFTIQARSTNTRFTYVQSSTLSIHTRPQFFRVFPVSRIMCDNVCSSLFPK